MKTYEVTYRYAVQGVVHRDKMLIGASTLGLVTIYAEMDLAQRARQYGWEGWGIESRQEVA